MVFILKQGPSLITMQSNITIIAYSITNHRSFFSYWDQDKMAAIFADDIVKCIFLHENYCILFQISLKFVPKASIDNIPALVQMMAWHQPGNKPLSEPMMVRLPMRYNDRESLVPPLMTKLASWQLSYFSEQYWPELKSTVKSLSVPCCRNAQWKATRLIQGHSLPSKVTH